jgi:hypothetical protein
MLQLWIIIAKRKPSAGGGVQHQGLIMAQANEHLKDRVCADFFSPRACNFAGVSCALSRQLVGLTCAALYKSCSDSDANAPALPPPAAVC